jgi:nucleotide-binding universal stress UspA family protein
MKILMPVDGSPYTRRMLDYLEAHPELLGSGHEFVAFTVVPPIPGHAARFVDRAIVDDYYRTHAEEVLQPVQEIATERGWNLRTAHGCGHPADVIAAFAASEKPDLIVMGTHGHSALGNVMLGSVVSGVLARCTQPVLLLR